MGVAGTELGGEVEGGFGAEGWGGILDELNIGERLVVALVGVDGEGGKGGGELRGEVWAGEEVSWKLIGD